MLVSLSIKTSDWEIVSEGGKSIYKEHKANRSSKV